MKKTEPLNYVHWDDEKDYLNTGKFFKAELINEEKLNRILDPWIPVTERLPEPGVQCLVWRSKPGIISVDSIKEIFLSSGPINDWTYNYVTHWMPLPEGPKQ